MRAGLERAHSFVKRSGRAVRIVVGHGSIPRPIRWLAALGLLPIPGPFDEAVLLVVGAILGVFYRDQLREAWKQAGIPGIGELAGDRAVGRDGDRP
jgi:hypothetical protein